MSYRKRLLLFLVCGLGLLVSTVTYAATEINFVGAWGGEYRLKVLGELVSAFERENPGVKVNIVNIGGWQACEEKAKVMIAGGAPPDLLYMGETGGLTAFADAGLLTPLDSFVTNQKGVSLTDFIHKDTYWGS